MAKIVQITDGKIVFDTGDVITYYHNQDYCECNYADFEQLDDLALQAEFDTECMEFEAVDGCGFRFGNGANMFFVPCYSEQNGYYATDLDIYYNNVRVLNLECEERFN